MDVTEVTSTTCGGGKQTPAQPRHSMGDAAAAEHPAHTAPAQRPHPHSAPVYVRFDLRQKPFELHSKAPLHLLSVQIAGLADGAEYQTCCLVSRPRDAGAPVLQESRRTERLFGAGGSGRCSHATAGCKLKTLTGPGYDARGDTRIKAFVRLVAAAAAV